MDVFLHKILDYPFEKISQRVLYLQMMDWDRFSRNDPIGEVFTDKKEAFLDNKAKFCKFLGFCTTQSSPSILRSTNIHRASRSLHSHSKKSL